MKDNNDNNLGDFFRKKFNDFDSSPSNWNLPDQQLKDSLLEQIANNTSAPAKQNNKKLLLLGLLALCLLSAGTYIWYLQQQNKQLKTIVAEQSDQITLTQKQLNNTIAKHQDEQKEHADAKVQLQTVQQNSQQQTLQLKRDLDLQANHIALIQNKLQAQEKIVQQLAGEKLLLNNQLNLAKSQKATASTVAGSDNSAQLNKRLHSTVKGINKLPTRWQQQWPEQSTKKLTQEPVITLSTTGNSFQRFKVGYEYSLVEFKLPADRTFEKQRSLGSNFDNRSLFTSAQGLLVGYSPKRNWWIRTGLRFSRFKFQQTNHIGLSYDSSYEEIQVDHRRNVLYMTLNTPYAKAKNSFDIRIPTGTELNEDDLLELSIQESLTIRFFQVPLGVEYLYGKGKIQWRWQAGVQYNKILFGDYNVEVEASSRQQEIGVDYSELSRSSVVTKQFLGSYAGLGLNYHLTGHWHSTAAFCYHYNFINNSNTPFSNSTKRHSAFNVGLNYQF